MTIFGYTIATSVITYTLTILLIVVLTIIANRLVGKLIRKSLSVTDTLPAASIFVNIARAAIVILGAMTILSVLDISITPVITALGVSGLAVALALQDTLSNLFAGLQIIVSRQIRPGDYVQLDSGQEGSVVDIAWRTTTLKTIADNLIIVPNSKLSQAIIMNYRLPAEPLSVYVDFGAGYGADLDRVEVVATEVATEVMRELQPDVAPERAIIRFKSFDDSQITGFAVLRVHEYTDQYLLKSTFIKRLHARFAEEGLDFPFPTRTVHISK